MTRSECPVVAATGGHVDDFVFVGKEGNKVLRKQQRKKLQDHNRWKMWERDNFLQYGVRVENHKDGGFLLSQNEFVDELREITDLKPTKKRKGQSSYTVRTNRTERTLGWFGRKCERQVRNTALRQDCNVPALSVQDMIGQSTTSTSQEKKWTSHTDLQFSY